MSDIKQIDKKRKELLLTRATLIQELSVCTKEKREAIQAKLAALNADLKILNIDYIEKKEYIKYQILWECAKSYIPVEEKQMFFQKVNAYVELAIQNGQIKQ